MAYDTQALEQSAIKAIKKYNLRYITEVADRLPCNRSLIYRKKIHKLPKVIDALNKNVAALMQTDSGVSAVVARKEKQRKGKGNGYLYIVKCGDFDYYKIGVSKAAVGGRLSNLQSGCPFPLKMIDVFYCTHYSQLEHELHQKYRSKNISGEWYELTDKELAEITRLAELASNVQLELNLNC